MSPRLPHIPLPPIGLPVPRTLALPVRDLLRGVRKAMEGPRRLFEPMRSVLPRGFGDATGSVASGALRSIGLTRGPVGHPDELAAAARLAPSIFVTDGDFAAVFARLSYRGLRFVLSRLDRDDLLISETIAAFAFHHAIMQAALGDTASDRAAAVAVALTQHHVVGVAPGTGIGLSEGDITEGRLAIFVVMLWLLIERPKAAADEAALLSLCFDLALSEQAAIDAAQDDAARLSDLLATFARLI